MQFACCGLILNNVGTQLKMDSEPATKINKVGIKHHPVLQTAHIGAFQARHEKHTGSLDVKSRWGIAPKHSKMVAMKESSGLSRDKYTLNMGEDSIANGHRSGGCYRSRQISFKTMGLLTVWDIDYG